MFKGINGLLLPGGGVSLLDSEYAKAAKVFYNLALKANSQGNYFPIWGTCLGFELLTVLTAGEKLLAKCYAEDVSFPLQFLPGVGDSRIVQSMPPHIFQSLLKYNVTANFHTSCLTPQNFTATKALNTFYRPISTNLDMKGKRFISMIEAYDYPIYGSQFHPEKNPFLWRVDYTGISHDLVAVQVAQYFANFFVQEARKSTHKFPDLAHESAVLIYNYQPLYSGSPRFDLNYFFNYTSNLTVWHHTAYHNSQPTPHPKHIHRCYPHEATASSHVAAGCGLGDYPLIVLSLGMLACLIVGLQIGRCIEAHTNSETWPDVLSWLIHNQKHIASNRAAAKDGMEGPSGQRVRLLQTDKHYFMMEADGTEDEEN